MGEGPCAAVNEVIVSSSDQKTPLPADPAERHSSAVLLLPDLPEDHSFIPREEHSWSIVQSWFSAECKRLWLLLHLTSGFGETDVSFFLIELYCWLLLIKSMMQKRLQLYVRNVGLWLSGTAADALGMKGTLDGWAGEHFNQQTSPLNLLSRSFKICVMIHHPVKYVHVAINYTNVSEAVWIFDSFSPAQLHNGWTDVVSSVSMSITLNMSITHRELLGELEDRKLSSACTQHD